MHIRIALPGGSGQAHFVAKKLEATLGEVVRTEAAAASRRFTAPSAKSRLVLVPDPVLHIETGARRATLLGTALPLTRLEFDLLHFLCTHPDHVYTRNALKEALWPSQAGNDRTVDVHVRRLRARLNPHLQPITTVRGIGYRFEGSAPVAVA